MKPGCAPFEHELSAWLDGELAPAERARIEAHLHECARCTAEVRELRRVGDTLRRWDAQETRYATSTGFRNRVISRLGDVEPVATEEQRVWRRAAWAAAAAAGIVGAVAWVSALRTGPAADLVALADRVHRIEAEMAAQRRPSDPPPPREPPTTPPVAVERLGDVPAIVGPPSASPEVVAGETEDPWEVRGEGLLHRDAVAAYEEYLKERRRLSFEAKFFDAVERTEGGATSVAAQAPPPLGAFLGHVAVTTTAYPPFERVQVWPIERAPSAKIVPPLALGEAIMRRALAVVEDDDADTVIAENTDLRGRSVLLLAGDVLRGGRRDRVLREDLLVPPGRRISLPVFAAAVGGRKSSYRRFTRSDLIAPFDLRGLVATGYVGADVGQRDVDLAIASTLRGLESRGPDSSIENLATNTVLSREVDRYAAVFRARLDGKNVVGFAFAVGSRVVGAELCGDPETFRTLRDGLLKSHVLYALSADAVQGPPPAASEVQAVFAAASRAVFDEPAVTGDATLSVFRERDGEIFGYGLLDNGHVVHATVFAGMPAGAAADAATKGRGPFGTGPTSSPPGARDPASSSPERGTAPEPGGLK